MTWYLFDHPNRYAPVRSNGIRFWGYPQRTAPIRLLVVHTPEVLPDYTGSDNTAEAVAAYFASTSRPASAHVCIDRDSTVECLPDEAVAFHVAGYNSASLGAEIGHAHNAWGQNPQSDEAVLRRAATWYAAKAVTYGIPAVRLTRSQVDAGQSGFAAHADLDPTRRSDPGKLFDWPRFFDYVRQEMNDMSAREWTRDTWQALVDAGIVEPKTAATVDYWSDPARTNAELAHAENVVVQGLARRSHEAKHSHKVTGSAS